MAQIFLGNELMRIDQKGRVGIPARFMPVLRAVSADQADSVGLMITPERSIRILPLPVFIEEVERWNRLDDLDESERMIKNMATGLAELVTLDRQNRVKLNPLMMELCEIRQQVVVVGSLHTMQVFDLDVWKSMFKTGLDRLGAAMQKMSEKERPKPQPSIKQFIINTADVEARENDPAEH